MEKLSLQTKIVLGMQHVLAMFGATVLVPFLTGLNPSIALDVYKRQVKTQYNIPIYFYIIRSV